MSESNCAVRGAWVKTHVPAGDENWIRPIWLALILVITTRVAGNAIVTDEFIFQDAPFRECHASTIAQTPTGLVTAWFGGTREKNPDVTIWVSRHVDGKWTAPLSVADGRQPDGTRQPCWNPVLFRPSTGPLLLFYKVGPSPTKWCGVLRFSNDDGRTWGPAEHLPDGILGPIKNKPVQLADGSILCGSSTEDKGWRVHFERSIDLGKTWTATAPVNDGKTIAAIQPSILLQPGGRLQAVGRTRQGRIFEVWSGDGGHTWGPMALSSLPNPNSGIDAVTLNDGRHLIVYNHVSGDEGERSPLNVAISDDDKAWKAALILENEPGREFSYPAVIQSADGMIHITYTWKRRRIRHVVVDPAQLTLKPIVNGAWPQ